MLKSTREAGRRPSALPDFVVAWRIRRLRDVGFGPELADELARDRDYDLHAVLELVHRGCTPELATRILAPVGTGPC